MHLPAHLGSRNRSCKVCLSENNNPRTLLLGITTEDGSIAALSGADAEQGSATGRAWDAHRLLGKDRRV
jgi:hypothetical protein